MAPMLGYAVLYTFPKVSDFGRKSTCPKNRMLAGARPTAIVVISIIEIDLSFVGNLNKLYVHYYTRVVT